MRHVSGLLVAALLLGSGATWATDSTATRGAALVLKVEKFEATRQKVVELTQAQGGTLGEAHAHVAEKGRRHGALTLTVPAEKLEPLLSQLRALGVPSGERITTVEHWAESEELTRRAERSRGHQTRLSGLMTSTRRLRGSDLLYVEERLVRAENEEDALRLQREKLGRAAQQSRISLVLFEPLATPTSRLTHPRRELILEWLPTAVKALLWLAGIALGLTLWRRWRRARG